MKKLLLDKYIVKALSLCDKVKLSNEAIIGITLYDMLAIDADPHLTKEEADEETYYIRGDMFKQLLKHTDKDVFITVSSIIKEPDNELDTPRTMINIKATSTNSIDSVLLTDNAAKEFPDFNFQEMYNRYNYPEEGEHQFRYESDRFAIMSCLPKPIFQIAQYPDKRVFVLLYHYEHIKGVSSITYEI